MRLYLFLDEVLKLFNYSTPLCHFMSVPNNDQSSQSAKPSPGVRQVDVSTRIKRSLQGLMVCTVCVVQMVLLTVKYLYLCHRTGGPRYPESQVTHRRLEVTPAVTICINPIKTNAPAPQSPLALQTPSSMPRPRCAGHRAATAHRHGGARRWPIFATRANCPSDPHACRTRDAKS